MESVKSITLRYSTSFKGLMVASLQFHILLSHDSKVLHTKMNPKAAKSMRVLYFSEENLKTGYQGL